MRKGIDDDLVGVATEPSEINIWMSRQVLSTPLTSCYLRDDLTTAAPASFRDLRGKPLGTQDIGDYISYQRAFPRALEAAMAVGLSYWKSMRLIVLPQALRVTIPNIVSSYIGLFKDTTLVFVVGIFDFLRAIEAARIDPNWATPVTSTTGYAFAAMFYFIFCYSMARYARFVEARLAAGDKR